MTLFTRGRLGLCLVGLGLSAASAARAGEVVLSESLYMAVPILDGQATGRLNTGFGVDNQVGWRFKLGSFELTPQLTLGLTSITSSREGFVAPPSSGLRPPDFLFLQPGLGVHVAFATQLRPSAWLRGTLMLGPNIEFTGGYQVGAALDGELKPGLRLGARAALTFVHAFFYPDLFEGTDLGWWSLGAYLEVAFGPPGAGA